MLFMKDGAPVIITINDRRFTICNDPIHYADGSLVQYGPSAYCGTLIDVTEAKQIRVTDSCGREHLYNEIDIFNGNPAPAPVHANH